MKYKKEQKVIQKTEMALENTKCMNELKDNENPELQLEEEEEKEEEKKKKQKNGKNNEKKQQQPKKEKKEKGGKNQNPAHNKQQLFMRNVIGFIGEIESVNEEQTKKSYNKFQDENYNYMQYGYILTSSDDEEEEEETNQEEDEYQPQKVKKEKKNEKKEQKNEENGQVKQEDTQSQATHQTLENRPYIRRENMIATFKQFHVYHSKQKNYDYIPLQFNNVIFDKEEDKQQFKMKYQAIKTLQGFINQGVKEQYIYNYILEKSMDPGKLRQWCLKFFEPYLKDISVQSAFDREFSYRKGNIDYFDPDFQGHINTFTSRHSLQYHMILSGYKDKLYMRVMMTMLKKLGRYIIQFQMLEHSVHSQCGKHIEYNVTFYFNYRLNLLGGNRKPPQPQKHVLADNLVVTIYYIQSQNKLDNFDSFNLKVEKQEEKEEEVGGGGDSFREKGEASTIINEEETEYRFKQKLIPKFTKEQEISVKQEEI